MKPLWKMLGFQIFLYRGSQVPINKYTPLLDSLQKRFSDQTNATITTKSYSFLTRNEFSNDTFVIGHSFGGFFALLDAKKDALTKKKIKGIVLLNSHFNSQKQTFYPGISQSSIYIPVLSIAGGKDKRLPLSTVLPDYWEKQEKRLTNKHYKFYPQFNHFSGINDVETPETETIANDIEAFIRNIIDTNTTRTNFESNLVQNDRYSFQKLESKIPNAIRMNESLHLLDALYRIVLKKFFWEWLHQIGFLFTRPTKNINYVYKDPTDHILIKSTNLTRQHLVSLCKECLSSQYSIQEKIITVPSNLFGLYIWLLFPLSTHSQNQTLQWPILQLPITPNVTYYKTLHPRQMLLKNIDSVSF